MINRVIDKSIDRSKDKKSVQVLVDLETHEWLRQASFEARKPMKSIIVDLIAEYRSAQSNDNSTNQLIDSSHLDKTDKPESKSLSFEEFFDGLTDEPVINKNLEACYLCQSRRFWRRSDNGQVICARCHPPVSNQKVFEI